MYQIKGDTKNTNLVTPDSNDDIVITNDMIHFNVSQYNQLVLACNTSYPAEWMYENAVD